MLRSQLFKYSIYLNYLFKDECILMKTIQNSSRAIFGSICRIRNIEIERLFSQNFKYKYKEKKTKYLTNFGRFLLGATVFSFAEDKISDEEIKQHFQEFQIDLPEENSTVTVEEKKTIKKPYRKIPQIKGKTFYNAHDFLTKYKVNSEKAKETSQSSSFSKYTNRKLSTENLKGFIDASWSQLINSKTVKLWRRPVPTNPKVFEYRLCGTFDDISARSFLTVQTDIEYRKEWDDLIVDLNIIRNDPESNTDTIRWVTHYPYPMGDREYIFKRRSIVVHENQIALIVSKAVNGNYFVSEKHRSLVRIIDYKSLMYIQAHNTFDKVGMDYFLIYYDDPKTNFPSPAVSWMSTAGIPKFMEKVHKASLRLEQITATNQNDPLNYKDDSNMIDTDVLQQDFLSESSQDAPFYSYLTNAFASVDFDYFKTKFKPYPEAQKPE